MEFTGDVYIRVEGRVGRVTLNRPQALNALNETIAVAMLQALRRWSSDDAIDLVLVDSEGDRAFCAGGDLSAIYRDGVAGEYESAHRFWRTEYRLDRLIAAFPKPYTVIMDGFVMGGGVGISSHGSHRIVTEGSVVAMPECSIGLITDAGGTWLLSEAPGFVGEYLGLTGHRMKAADAIYAGFADVFVPRLTIPELKMALVESGSTEALTAFACAPTNTADLEMMRSDIDQIFAAGSVSEIVERLDGSAAEWAAVAAKSIRAASPLALTVTLEGIRYARQASSLDHALINEYRFSSRSLEYGDFLEGIRAVVIDKDRNPQWRHGDLKSVPSELIASMFREAEGGDPDFATGDEQL